MKLVCGGLFCPGTGSNSIHRYMGKWSHIEGVTDRGTSHVWISDGYDGVRSILFSNRIYQLRDGASVSIYLLFNLSDMIAVEQGSSNMT